MRSPGSFGLPDHPGRLPRTGGPPGAPGRHVDPGAFRPVLTEAPGHGDRPEGGRPPCDDVRDSGAGRGFPGLGPEGPLRTEDGPAVSREAGRVRPPPVRFRTGTSPTPG